MQKEVVDSLYKIKTLNESRGGQELVANARKNIEALTYQLTIKYPTASQIELISIISKIDALMELIDELETAEEKFNNSKEELEQENR